MVFQILGWFFSNLGTDCTDALVVLYGTVLVHAFLIERQKLLFLVKVYIFYQLALYTQ